MSPAPAEHGSRGEGDPPRSPDPPRPAARTRPTADPRPAPHKAGTAPDAGWAAPSDGRAAPADERATPDRRALRRLRSRILEWYGSNGRDLPWRHTTDPYAVLVSEVMLQQTQVARVVPRYLEWLAAYPSLEDLAAAPLGEVLLRWQGLGYNTRARRLHDCARHVVDAAGPGSAALPATLAGLEPLPGVGPYTARAVMVFAHNADVAAVDANVRRVLTHELGLPPDLSDSRLQDVAAAALPPGRSRDWHNALMDYGALVLTARRTGIGPRRRQSPFEGSRRQLRARVLRAVLHDGARTIDEIAIELERTPDEIADLVDTLVRDGLLRRVGDRVGVA